LFVVVYRSKCLGIWIRVDSVSVSRCPVFPIVAKLCVAAGENVCARSDHVLREGKLLAVENKSLPVFVEIAFAASASPLERLGAVLLCLDLFVVGADFIVVA